MEYLEPTASGLFLPVDPAFHPDVLNYTIDVPANGVMLKISPIAAAGSEIRSVAVNSAPETPDSSGVYVLSLNPGDNEVTVSVREMGDPSYQTLVYYTFNVHRDTLPAALTSWKATNSDGYFEFTPDGVNTYKAVLENYSSSVTLSVYGVASAVINYSMGTVNSVDDSGWQKLVIGSLPHGSVNLSLTMYDAHHNAVGASQTLFLQNGIQPQGISDWTARVSGVDKSWKKVEGSNRYYVSIPESTNSFDLRMFFSFSSTTASLYRLNDFSAALANFSGTTWLSNTIPLSAGINAFTLKTVNGGVESFADLVVVRDSTTPVIYDSNTLFQLRDRSASTLYTDESAGARIFLATVDSNDLDLSFSGYPYRDIVVTSNETRLQDSGGIYDLQSVLTPGMNVLVVTLYSNYSSVVDSYDYYLMIDYVPQDLRLSGIEGASLADAGNPTVYEAPLFPGQYALNFKPIWSHSGEPGATITVQAEDMTIGANTDGSYDVYLPPGRSSEYILVKVEYGTQFLYYVLELYPHMIYY